MTLYVGSHASIGEAKSFIRIIRIRINCANTNSYIPFIIIQVNNIPSIIISGLEKAKTVRMKTQVMIGFFGHVDLTSIKAISKVYRERSLDER